MTLANGSADPATRPAFVDRYAWVPYALILATVLCFAGNHVVGRAVGPVLPPFALVFWRALVAVALLLPFVVPALRRSWPQLRAAWPVLLRLTLLQVVIGQSALFLGLQTTTAINAGLINATLPVLTVGLAAVVLREPVRARQWLGLAVALAGSLAIIARGDIDALLGLRFVVGDLWIQLAFIVWAFYNIAVNRLPRALNPFVAFFAFTAMALPLQGLLYLGETVVLGGHAPVTWGGVGAIAYTAVFGSIVALICLNVGISRLGSARTGYLFNLVPAFTVLFAVTLLGERLHGFHFLGIALVFAGVALSTRRRPRPA